MAERKFGVEIECGHPTNSEGVREMLKEQKGIGNWSVGCDGSGVEARSPILEGAEGEDTLRKVMDLIRDSGGYTTRSDGMHIHLDGCDFIEAPKEPVIRVMESWVNNQKIIDQFVHPWRRESPMCVKSVTKVSVDTAKKNGVIRGGGGALNLSNIVHARTAVMQGAAYSKAQPTFEVRLHEGTLDPDEAIPWIRLLRTMLDMCFEGAVIKPCKDHVAFLSELGIKGDTLDALVNKATTSDHKKFGNRPYDPKGNANPGHWWCQAGSHGGGCGGAWHKDDEDCPRGYLRDEYLQDSYHGKYVTAGGN